MLKKLLKNRAGTAEIIGSVMFVVIIMFFFSGVYLWHDQATREMNNMLSDKTNSIITINVVTEGYDVTNNGSIDIILSRLWIVNVTDTGTDQIHEYANLEPLNARMAAGTALTIILDSPTAYNVDGSVNATKDKTGIHVYYVPTSAQPATLRFEVLTTRGTVASCTDTIPGT